MSGISGIILTHNNERTIKDAVHSIKDIVDELLVVDDFSTDRTVEMIKEVYPGARVVQRKLDRFDLQRNFALERASYDLILMVDSDEVITQELKKNILEAIKNPKHKAYRCTIINKPFGARVALRLERPILFEKSLRFEGALHERVNTDNFGWLKGELIHEAWVDAADWIDDMNHYSTHAAKRWIMEGRNYNLVQLFLIGLLMPLYHFLKMYFGQQRFKNGLFAGLLYSLACSAEWTFTALKYYEMKFIKKVTETTTVKRNTKY